MWTLAEKRPVLLLCGDQAQMSGFGDERMWHTPVWRNRLLTFHIDLKQIHRLDKSPGGERLRSILSELRHCEPSEVTLQQLQSPALRAWTPIGPPTSEGMRRLLKLHPNTDILTVSREGMGAVNESVLEALYPRYHHVTNFRVGFGWSILYTKINQFFKIWT